MGMLFNNWLEEGYYKEDEYNGGYERASEEEFKELSEEGKLFYSDGSGYGVTQVNEIEQE